MKEATKKRPHGSEDATGKDDSSVATPVATIFRPLRREDATDTKRKILCQR
jgi:hypothetical protein